MRTSALSRHGIHRLEIVSRSRLRELLAAAAETAVRARRGEKAEAVPEAAFRSGCLARLERAEGLAERLRGQIAALGGAVAALERVPAEPHAGLFAGGAGSAPPLRRRIARIDARRLALIREMMRPDIMAHPDPEA